MSSWYKKQTRIQVLSHLVVLISSCGNSSPHSDTRRTYLPCPVINIKQKGLLSFTGSEVSFCSITLGNVAVLYILVGARSRGNRLSHGNQGAKKKRKQEIWVQIFLQVACHWWPHPSSFAPVLKILPPPNSTLSWRPSTEPWALEGHFRAKL